MNRYIKSTIFAALLGLASPAWAAGQHYVGAGAGGFNIGNGIEKKMAGGGYLQLGHNFSDWLGAEIRLGMTGSANVSQPVSARQRLDFVAHFIKPYIEVSDGLNLYGLAGFAVTHSSYQPNGGVKVTKNRISYAYGVGASYRINADYSAGVDLWHMNGKPNNTPAAIGTNFLGLEATAFTAGIRYNF